MRRPAPSTAALLVTALAFHVDMLLYYLLVPLLPRYARDLGLNPIKVGILFGSYAVALLLAAHIPRRRERVQHIGLFGYSRGMGKVSLPRAISFTAALYSLGVPPELIGTGRGLAAARQSGKLPLIEKYYKNLEHDLYFAGKFLYKAGLVSLAKKSKVWKDVLTDVEEIEKYLGKPLAPKYLNEQEHQLISARIHKNLHSGKKLGRLIEQSAVLRHSMG